MITAQAEAQARQQQQAQAARDRHLIEAVIAAFAAYQTIKGITAALRAPFAAAGIGTPAVQAAVTLLASWPLEPMEGTGPASRWAVRANLLRRGAFFVSAARRAQAAVTDARAGGEPVLGALGGALTSEKRFFAQHVAASSARVKAGAQVDGAAGQYGPLLGWKTWLDDRTSPGCRAADGKNFRADSPPIVEGHPSLPGAVHPHCRCLAVRPYRDAALLPSVRSAA